MYLSTLQLSALDQMNAALQASFKLIYDGMHLTYDECLCVTWMSRISS